MNISKGLGQSWNDRKQVGHTQSGGQTTAAFYYTIRFYKPSSKREKRAILMFSPILVMVSCSKS